MKSLFKYSFLIILLHTYCSFYSIGQTKKLSINLTVENSSLSQIEPLFYKIEIINNGETIQKISRPWTNINIPELEYYDEKTNKWNKLVGSNKSNYARFNPFSKEAFGRISEVIIKPQEILKNEFAYFFIQDDYASANYLFSPNEEFKIRAIYNSDLENNLYIHSNEVTIQIKNDSENDKEAFEFLQKATIPHFIFESIIFNSFWGLSHDYTGFDGIKTAEEVILKFPKSKFVSWAYLHLAWNEYLSAEKVYLSSEEVQNKNLIQEKILKTESFLESCLGNKTLKIETFAKSLYFQIVNLKMNANLYNNLEDYIKDLDYIESSY